MEYTEGAEPVRSLKPVFWRLQSTDENEVSFYMQLTELKVLQYECSDALWLAAMEIPTREDLFNDQIWSIEVHSSPPGSAGWASARTRQQRLLVQPQM